MPTLDTAITAIKEEDHRRLWVMGSLLEIIVTGEETGGVYAVAEVARRRGSDRLPTCTLVRTRRSTCSRASTPSAAKMGRYGPGRAP